MTPASINTRHTGVTRRSTLRAVFVDATPTLGEVAQKLLGTIDIPFAINRQPDIRSEAIPTTLAGAEILVIDHTQFPTVVARQCTGLKHVVFLGTGARSYMSPEELGELGVEVHTIKGYGDTAVAECAVALMWTAARGFARMDREMRSGNWLRSDSLQLTGRTIGLLGFGGIATEVARLTLGMGMKVLAWNRSPKAFPGVQFVELDRLLADSDVLSLHLLLNEDTKNFLSRERIAAMRPGAILINTARGGLVDESALAAALRAGQIAGAGFDVLSVEPPPDSHPLLQPGLPNFLLTPHVAWASAGAMRTLAEELRTNIERWAEGAPRNLVT
jgi:D-3-phosphoglycerate dehydrogenase / 2-oxoglutarate reductase